MRSSFIQNLDRTGIAAKPMPNSFVNYSGTPEAALRRENNEEYVMKTNRRWMNSILQSDLNAVVLPWARGQLRVVWKDNIKTRIRAA